MLRSIGYLVDAPSDVNVATEHVDPELASIAGPQLVVPVDNARYALNAANARWGSLYDALYGTDAIPETMGPHAVAGTTRNVEPRSSPFAEPCLTSAFPSPKAPMRRARVHSRRREPGCRDHSGPRASPTGPVCGLHRVTRRALNHPASTPRTPPRDRDRSGPHIGADDAAHVADIRLESALTAIMDCEDSVATVDAADKVLAYGNWLGLMKGTLTETFAKGDQTVERALEADCDYIAPGGQPLTVRRRSLMLVRNVGLHLMTDIVKLDGRPIAETILDAAITAWAAKHDVLRLGRHRNSLAGSVYIVKPKMHGPDEVAFASELFAGVEELLGLEPTPSRWGSWTRSAARL